MKVYLDQQPRITTVPNSLMSSTQVWDLDAQLLYWRVEPLRNDNDALLDPRKVSPRNTKTTDSIGRV